MTDTTATVSHAEPDDIKRVPQDPADRGRIRAAAEQAAADLDPTCPPLRSELERRAAAALEQLSLPPEFLGFAMVAVSNAFWRPQFEAVPHDRRMLFLPRCLRDRDRCEGESRGAEFHCAGCGACTLCDLKSAADALGCHVVIADGTPAVLTRLAECNADALLGVACLDSLDKAFSKAAALGVPCVALPLLRDGCAETEAEVGRVQSLIRAERAVSAIRSRTYAPLLRETVRMFEPDELVRLLRAAMHDAARWTETDKLAVDWIRAGGKRFRPFITLAAYAVSRHGPDALAADADVAAMLPEGVREIAVAIEALHKASLVHDDIEDDDALRYGRETLHRTHGAPAAINIGDHLVGLGYRLIAGQAASLGDACAADILARLSAAHLDLCRGQGEELLWRDGPGGDLKAIDALAIYALKTAPAFEAALFAGLRAGGAEIDTERLRRFCLYVGEAYQILNDLDDWGAAGGPKMGAPRPTVLRALAAEAGAPDELAGAAGDAGRMRSLYERLGVFDKARRLVHKLRTRAADLASGAPEPALRDLLHFIVRVVL